VTLPTLIVLGMHRSGTSSVTGALTLAGASPPLTLMPAKPDNPTGFWESERIADFNDGLLARMGVAWDTLGELPAADLASDPDLVAAMVDLLNEEFPAPEGPPALKDPRICRLAPPWIAAAASWGRPARILLPVRPPAEVAASLRTRNGFEISHGLRLWIDHVRQAERDSRGVPRAVVMWPDVLAAPGATLKRALDQMGLALDTTTPAASLTAFIDPARRHERLDLSEIDDPAGDAALEVYAAMAALSLDPSDAAAMQRLDALSPALP
jgi:hypothetical protein